MEAFSENSANEKLLVKVIKNESKKSSDPHKPTRRPTIAMSTVDLYANKNGKDSSNETSNDYETLTDILINMKNEEEDSLLRTYNEFNYLTNQELRQQLHGNQPTNHSRIFRYSTKIDKTNLDKAESNMLHSSKKMVSKSIANLPSLTNKSFALGPLKEALINAKKANKKQEHQVKTTILNLSPLSISASSVSNSTSSSSHSNSSSINSLINNVNKNKIKLDKVATNLASEVGSVNTIATETKNISNESSNSSETDSNSLNASKFHSNFVKQQNIHFNCTFESLI